MTEQTKALVSIAKKFVEGELWDAKLMATIIYVICHDGWSARSLITQLGVRNTLKCINTANKAEPGNIARMPLLLAIGIGGEGFWQISLYQIKDVKDFEWLPFIDGGINQFIAEERRKSLRARS